MSEGTDRASIRETEPVPGYGYVRREIPLKKPIIDDVYLAPGEAAIFRKSLGYVVVKQREFLKKAAEIQDGKDLECVAVVLAENGQLFVSPKFRRDTSMGLDARVTQRGHTFNIGKRKYRAIWGENRDEIDQARLLDDIDI